MLTKAHKLSIKVIRNDWRLQRTIGMIISTACGYGLLEVVRTGYWVGASSWTREDDFGLAL